MIFTVTLNVGFDEYFIVPRVRPGGVSQVLSYRAYASGKGINAARAIRALGEEVQVIALVGDKDEELFKTMISSEGLSGSLVTVRGSLRRNLTLLEQESHLPASHFRADGLAVDNEEVVQIVVETIESRVRSGDIVSLHGSVPQGLSTQTWATIARAIRQRGAKVVVDVYDEPLPLVLDGGPIFACKTNEEESHILPNVKHLPREPALSTGLDFMRCKGVEFPFISLGRAGIAFLEDGRVWRASCQAPRELIFVGAGDACMGSLAVSLARGVRSIRDIASLMAAVGAAYVGDLETECLVSAAQELLSSVHLEPFASS